MGNHVGRAADQHPQDRIYTHLFEELSVKTQSGIPVLHQQSFQGVFGGPWSDLGELLYSKLFDSYSTPITLPEFIKVCSSLEKTLSSGQDRHASLDFLFSLFSKGENEIHIKELERIVFYAMGYSLVMGTAQHMEAWPKDTPPVVKSIVKDMSHHADKDTQEISGGRFKVWALHHLPRLMEGIQQWILAALHGHYVTGMDGASKEQILDGGYHLPDLDTPPDTPILLNVPTVWALSCVLPTCHIGHSRDERHPEDHPVGGRWTLLYSSAKHGFSLNRFIHHSSDYGEPSVVVLECPAATGEDYAFAIAVDSAWKEGEFFWGKEQCCLIQLRPEFKKITCGSKLICLNEKGREFPKGLRVMAEPGESVKSHLHIEEDFNKVHVFGGSETVTLKAVEVWGCGGAEAIEQQKKWKEWEKREVERRRKVTRESREAWVNSPDRAILEWGGVPTNHPKEQQQE